MDGISCIGNELLHTTRSGEDESSTRGHFSVPPADSNLRYLFFHFNPNDSALKIKADLSFVSLCTTSCLS